MAKRHAGLSAVPLGVALLLAAERAPAEVAFELGFRTGYGIPFGRYYERRGNVAGGYIADTATGQVPLWLDVGARLGGTLYLGAYAQYGFVVYSNDMSSTCAGLDAAAGDLGGGADCSFFDVRAGVNVHYHFGVPGESLDPWVGLGVGYEWISQGFSLRALGVEADIDSTLRGFEIVNAQLGLDFVLTEHLGLGPFFSLTLASFDHVSSSCEGDCTGDTVRSGDVDDGSLHHWLFLGVRGTYVF